MVKDVPNYITTNMIGLAHTSCKILDDSDNLILPVVLIIPKALRHSVSTNNRPRSGSHNPPSELRFIKSVYERIFIARAQEIAA